jgi:hypothetical protein
MNTRPDCIDRHTLNARNFSAAIPVDLEQHERRALGFIQLAQEPLERGAFLFRFCRKRAPMVCCSRVTSKRVCSLSAGSHGTNSASKAPMHAVALSAVDDAPPVKAPERRSR